MNNPFHLNQLLNYLDSFEKLPEALISEIADHVSFKTVKSGQNYIKKEAFDKRIGFLSNGIMRIYDLGKDGQEWNKAILNYQTILLGNPNFHEKAFHYISAITDSEIVEIPVCFFEKAIANYPVLSRIREKIIINIYNLKSQRESDLLSLNTKDHYLKLKDSLGHDFQKIPQYQLASYLGVTPIQLSRIRSALSG